MLSGLELADLCFRFRCQPGLRLQWFWVGKLAQKVARARIIPSGKLVSAVKQRCARGGMADTPDLGSGSVRIGGSSPLARTNFIEVLRKSEKVCTEVAQTPARTADKRVRFPVAIRYRGTTAKIYAPGGKFNYYRVAVTVAGRRRMQTFANYSDAKTAAERIVREVKQGSQAAALSASQSRDAKAALERLDGHFKSTGKRISLNAAVEGYLDAVGKLNVPLPDAVEG